MKTEGEARMPESRARTARETIAKPESRARSARKLRAKPKSRAKPETRAGRVPGSPSSENFCKINSEMMQPGEYFTSKLPDLAIVYKRALTATR